MQTELSCASPTKRYPNGRTGTQRGYMVHRHASEPACEACLAGLAEYERARYKPTGNPPGRPRVSEEDKRQRVNEYARRWRAANLERARELSRAYDKKRDPEKVRANGRRQGQRRRVIMDALKSGPCTDCGVSYPPYVMHFDHRDPSTKLFNVGKMGGHPMATVLAEVEKCDLVCANCHAERTWGPARRGAANERQDLRAG